MSSRSSRSSKVFAPRGHRAPSLLSPPQPRQIFVTPAQRRGGIRGIVVLEKRVTNPRLLAPSEDPREVDGTLTDIDHAMLRWARRILHVHEMNAPRIAREIRQRIGAGLGYPVEIELEHEQRRVGPLDQNVERHAPFHRDQLEIVVVIAELHPSRSNFLTNAIQLFGEAAVVV